MKILKPQNLFAGTPGIGSLHVSTSLLLAIGFLVLAFAGSDFVSAREITVIPGTKISTIQKALARAQNGDVIKVTRSTYLIEDLLIMLWSSSISCLIF